MTISSKGELELVGLMRQGDRFSYDLHYVITGPESFMEREGRSTYPFVFVNGGCILFIDAGTRVHLLDAKGLSFTQKCFHLYLLLSAIYLNLGAAYKIQGPVMS